MDAGCRLVAALPQVGIVHWGLDGCAKSKMERQSINFTIRWQEDGWTGVDYRIEITGSGQSV